MAKGTKGSNGGAGSTTAPCKACETGKGVHFGCAPLGEGPLSDPRRPAPGTAPVEEKEQVELVQVLPASRLRPHPENPRVPEHDEALEELKASIGNSGQHQPCLVRPIDYDWKGAEPDAGAPGSAFQIVIGHRRAIACQELGLDVECIVRAMSDEEALAIMLADNLQRTDPDPFLEAGVVLKLRAVEGMGIRETADVLGKSVGWVATRCELAKLVPAVAKKLRERGWPISALEDYARLAPAAQEAFLERTKWVHGREDLRRVLAEEFRELGKAPWPIDDAELLPIAGPCSACPKTSASTPALFEGEEGIEGDVRKARCRDPICWGQKMQACQGREAMKLLAATPEAVLVDEQFGHAGELAKAYPWADRKILRSPDLDLLEKKERGATPAVVLAAGGVARTAWVRAQNWAPARAKAEVKKAAEEGREKAEPKRSKAQRLAESMEDVRRRRMAVVVDLARDLVSHHAGKVSSASILAFVGSYALADVIGSDGYTMIGGSAQRRRLAGLELYGKDPAEWAAQAWKRFRHSVASSLRRVDPKELEGDYKEAAAVLELLKVDREPLEAKALERVPDPKWWGTSAAKKPAAAAAKKGKPAKKGKR